MKMFNALTVHWDLLWNLTVRDLKIRYKGSMLGFCWTVLNPLFMAVIYVVFLRLLAGGRGVAVNNEEIIIGVFAWQFTVSCVNAGMGCVTGNVNLVKKVYFPRIILPLSVTLSNFVSFLLTLVVQWGLLAVLLHMKGSMMTWEWTLVPLLSLYQLLFSFALALLAASANVYFRDTQYLMGLILSAWFFMSPVMYPLSFVNNVAASHPWVGQVYMQNPMAIIVTAYRALQLPGVEFPWSWASVLGILWPVVLFVVALVVFQRSQRYFSDVL